MTLALKRQTFCQSRWNKNWNVRNSYSYVATGTKIRFHFQFPRSPDAVFGGLIGWLFNWKCKFSCRIISNIATNLKYNYQAQNVLDGDGIDNVTLRLWKYSDFCSRHTVGVAGDDIMFRILVFFHIMIVKYGIHTTTWDYHETVILPYIYIYIYNLFFWMYYEFHNENFSAATELLQPDSTSSNWRQVYFSGSLFYLI